MQILGAMYWWVLSKGIIVFPYKWPAFIQSRIAGGPKAEGIWTGLDEQHIGEPEGEGEEASRRDSLGGRDFEAGANFPHEEGMKGVGGGHSVSEPVSVSD